MTPDPTPSDLARLREIAERARGAMCVCPWCEGLKLNEQGRWCGYCKGVGKALRTTLKDESDFRDAASPTAVLALLDELEAVRAENAELRDALAVIARGTTPIEKEGHYFAHRAAVKRARAALAPHAEKEEADQCPACWLDISPEQCGSQHCPRKSGKPVPANPVDRATRAVGERVYQRVAELMSAAPGTPEADELNRLADLVAAVEDGLDPDHV